MKNILSEIVAEKRITVDAAKKIFPLDEVKKNLSPGNFRPEKVIVKSGRSLIAECKLQSPAKGRLNETHSVVEMAKIYEENGAKMLSVHTDKHFLGSNEDFQKVRATVKLPLLRKDFVIDEYQIYEARLLGADAILLIVRILSPDELKKFLAVTHELGMNALVEIHDAEDLKVAQSTDAKFLGINNRNLKTFQTSIENTLQLMPQVDKSRIIISESGVFTFDDVQKLYAAGCDGLLIGEGLVRAPDMAAQTRRFGFFAED